MKLREVRAQEMGVLARLWEVTKLVREREQRRYVRSSRLPTSDEQLGRRGPRKLARHEELNFDY
jgi:hypothetical protein